MRAIVYDGKRTSLTTTHPEPEPGSGEALVRTVRAGVPRAMRRT